MIGERLKELRAQRNLSLRALAAQADVSATLLSQVERGVTEPSLETLRRLAAVFGESITALFAEPSAPSIWISRPNERVMLTAPRGAVSFERLTAGNGELEVLRAVMEPGQASAEEPRGHPSTECAYVVSGELTVQLGGAEYTVLAGESISFDARIPHRYRNASSTRTEVLLSMTPPTP